MAKCAVAMARRSVGIGRREQDLARLATGLFSLEDAISDLLRIEIAQAHAELRGPLGCWPEHPIKRGHRTIVEIGGGRPDAVQWARPVVSDFLDDRVGTICPFPP